MTGYRGISNARRFLGRDGEVVDLREAAVAYVRRGWPVALGTWLVESSSDGRILRRPRHAARPDAECSCAQRDCPRPGAHPAALRGIGPVSTDPVVVSYWWSKHRDACIILPTGRCFDVLDVPIQAGWDALARFDKAGVAVGPVASVEGRYLFFTAISCRETEDPLGRFWRGLRWHAYGSWVPGVPSLADSRWVREPFRPLPDPAQLLGTLLDACSTVHTTWQLPAQRPATVIAGR